MKRTRLGMGITVLAACMILQAAEGGDEKKAVDMGEMVVTTSRSGILLRDTPDIVQIIDRSQIDRIHPSGTGELIEYATGVAVETGTGSGLPDRSIVSLNGLPANYTLVLVDGVRLLTEHIHTGQNIESIPPQSIDRIEIMRGAASAQYGTDAIGGIVNIVTRKCKDKPEASIRAVVGSYETYEGGFSLLSPLGELVRLSMFFNWEQSDGISVTAPAHRVDNTGYERVNTMTRLDVDVSDATKLFAWVNWVDNTMDWRGDTAHSSLVSPVLGLSQKLSEALALSCQAAYSEWEAEVSEEKNLLLEPEAWLTWRSGGNHTVMGGVNYRWNEFERTSVVAPDQTAYGVFLQDEWVSGENVSVMLALRYDEVEDVKGALSPKLSAMYSPADSVRLRASVGRGFHAPTLQELYEEGYGHGGAAYRFGNPDLDPEYSTTYTVGMEFQPLDSVQVVLHGYYTDFEDMIVPVYQGPWAKDPSIDVWRRMNMENAEVYGGEAGLLWKLADGLELEGGYTVTGNEDKGTGRQLPYSPGSAVYGKLSVMQPLNPSLEMRGFIGARCVFGREAWNWKPAAGSDPANPDGLTTELKDYTKLDAGITCIYQKTYELFAKVENILGEDIENLDDAYTAIDGEPIVRVGMTYNLPLGK